MPTFYLLSVGGCIGSAYDLTNVYIEGCNNMRLPCFVTVGESVPVGIQFIAESQRKKKKLRNTLSCISALGNSKAVKIAQAKQCK
ncbi:hypothetical protein evm_005294 [Chilo suppressalis]|nr:hypothetical protein evm_005294 [Chilo suppressalis]